MFSKDPIHITHPNQCITFKYFFYVPCDFQYSHVNPVSHTVACRYGGILIASMQIH